MPYHADMASESKRHRLQRMHDEYRILCEEIPAPACALHFTNPFELLTATIPVSYTHLTLPTILLV